MAYIAGNTILDDEYNIFAWGNANGTINNTNDNVNTVAGTGVLDRGYGQSEVAAVTAGTVISATQWATLLNKITTVAAHQGSSISAITNPVATDPIAAIATLAGNVSTITTNRNNAAASGTAITAGGVVSRTTSWQNQIVFVQTITFGSTEQMRYFFNAGGRLTVAFSRSGGSATNKNTGWTALCTASGTINLTGASASKTIAAVAYTGTTKIGGSGTPNILNTGTGAEDLTGLNQVLFKQFDATAQYTLNFIQVEARVSGAVITIETRYDDDANANTDEIVDGTLTTTVTAVPPSTANLTSSWGTPVLAGSQSGT